MRTKLFDPAIIRDPQDAVEFLINILETSTEYAIIGKDLDGNILLWNEGARRLYGYAPEEVIGKANASILHTPDEVPTGKHREILESALRNGKWEGMVTRVRKNDQRFAARTTVMPRRNAEGAPIGFLFISKDISDEVRADEALRRARDELEARVKERTQELIEANARLEENNRQLKRLARCDELTGLYNRRYLLELLKQALLAARRYQLPLCVMMLDVDHFKRINDTYGHLLGDHVLATLGRLIRESLRASDIAGRYGGEEFCIILTHTSLQDARAVAEKLRRLVQAEGIPDDRGGILHVTYSIGIAALHPCLATLTELLHQADQALYEAKAAGRNQVMLADDVNGRSPTSQ